VLSLFRTNYFTTGFLLLFYALLLWAAELWMGFGGGLEVQEGFFARLLLDWLGRGSILSNVLAILLLFVQALLLNFLIARHRLDHQVTQFPGLFYILLNCYFVEYLQLTPILLGNTFLFLALLELFEMFKKYQVTTHLVNCGLWISIASLFYFPFIFFLIAAYIGVGILRAFRLKERIQFLIGALLPYYLLGVYFYVTGRWSAFWQETFDAPVGFLPALHISSSEDYLKFGLLLAGVLLVLANSRQYLIKKHIQAQRKVGILIWFLVIGLLSTVFVSEWTLLHFQILSIPMATFLAMTFASLRPGWAEALHFIFLSVALLWQFKPVLV